MLKQLSSLKLILLVNVILFGLGSFYISVIKGDAAALEKKNAQLVKDNGTKQAANDQQTKTILVLRSQIEQQNHLVSQQSLAAANIRQQTLDYKQQIKKVLELSNESTKTWADELVPDAIVSMFNNTPDRGGGTNKGNKSLTTITVNTGLSYTGILRENKLRSG